MNHWVLQERGLLKNYYSYATSKGHLIVAKQFTITYWLLLGCYVTEATSCYVTEAMSCSRLKVTVHLGLWINDRSGAILAASCVREESGAGGAAGPNTNVGQWRVEPSHCHSHQSVLFPPPHSREHPGHPISHQGNRSVAGVVIHAFLVIRSLTFRLCTFSQSSLWNSLSLSRPPPCCSHQWRATGQ